MSERFTPEETAEIIEEYNAKRAASIPIDNDLATAMKDASTGVKNYNENLKNSIENLKSQTLKFGKKMIDGESGLKAYNDVSSAGIDVVGQWGTKLPFLGKYSKGTAKAIAEYVKFANAQGDKIFSEYQIMSRSGLVLGMEDTFKNLENAGYTTAEFADYQKLMMENATNLAQFGGTAADGAKKFAEVAKTLNQSDSVEKLMLLGNSMNDINDAGLNYIRYQRLSGSTTIETYQQLAEHTKEYIEEQDRFKKYTGLTAKQQQSGKDEMLKLEQYALKNAQLQAVIDKGGPEAKIAKAKQDQNVELYNYVNQFNKKNADALALLMADATNNPNYAQAQRVYKRFYSLQEASKKRVVSTGEYLNALNADAEDIKNLNAGIATLGASDKNFLDYGGLTAQAAGHTTDYVKAEKDAKVAQTKQESGIIDAITGNMTRMLVRQRNTSQDADKLINEGIDPVVKSFNTLTGIAQELSGAIDVAIGKQDRVGGGQTLIQKMYNSVFGTGKTATQGSTPAASTATGSVPATAAPLSPSGGENIKPPGAKNNTNPVGPTNPASDKVKSNLGTNERSAQTGGVLSGPTSGYTATLHGTEAVVPLPDGKSIPVQSMTDDNGDTEEQIHLLAMKIKKLDNLISGMQKHVQMSSKILQLQS